MATEARFQDVKDLYALEATSNPKLAPNITTKCLAPKSIEKTNVSLSLAVFSERTRNAFDVL